MWLSADLYVTEELVHCGYGLVWYRGTHNRNTLGQAPIGLTDRQTYIRDGKKLSGGGSQ